MLEHLPQFLVAAMLSWSPASNHAYLHESSEYVEARYSDIATDLTKVVLEEDPLDVWDESDEVRRAHTAVLLLSIASYESGGFRSDVDRQNRSGRGDNGKSYCLMQLMTRSGERPPENRQACFREGLKRVRQSLDLCVSTDLSVRLAGYTAGSCIKGSASSRVRYVRMNQWWVQAPYFGVIDAV